jgi:zinc protease
MLPAKIDAVSAADVQRVAEKYLKPDSTVVVAVGDRTTIEPELKKLNLGTIEARDLSGNPVP